MWQCIVHLNVHKCVHIKASKEYRKGIEVLLYDPKRHDHFLAHGRLPKTKSPLYDPWLLPNPTTHFACIDNISSRIWDMSIPFNVWMRQVKHSFACTNSIIWFRIFLWVRKGNTYVEHQKQKIRRQRSSYIRVFLFISRLHVFKGSQVYIYKGPILVRV